MPLSTVAYPVMHSIQMATSEASSPWRALFCICHPVVKRRDLCLAALTPISASPTHAPLPKEDDLPVFGHSILHGGFVENHLIVIIEFKLIGAAH